MNDTQKQKLIRFLDDKVMAEAVHDVLLQAFLKNSSTDTNYLAASMIAVNKLGDAWKELQRYKREQSNENTRSNVGI